MIKINHLKFQYPDREFFLDIPELEIQSGSSTAIIGPSGTGKTTLLNLISGYLLPQTGSLLVNGSDPTILQERERRDFRIRQIGLIFQEFELIEYLSVLNNILLPYRISSSLQLSPIVRQRAEFLASEMGIRSKIHRNVKRLSHGERQRVAICRALITEPPILLCDEPTGNLDPENKKIIVDYLLKAVSLKNSTLVVVTHDHQLLPYFEQVIEFNNITQVPYAMGNEKRGIES